MRLLFLSGIILFWSLNSLAENKVLNLDIRQAIETANSDAPFTYEASKARRAEKGVAQGFWINVDTRDQEACQEVYHSIRNLKTNAAATSQQEFCRLDPANPMLSVMVFQDVNATEFRREINLSKLKTTDQSLMTDTRNLALTMVGMVGLLWVLPESISKWDKNDIRNSRNGIFTKYAENVSRKPVVDKDDWAINWIGHPLSGAAYYTLARHNNLSMMQSFGYSVVMSTFFWEYGFEAFAERPSIQDLLITPIIGSLLGEMFYRAEQNIRANDGRLAGSKKLGKVALVVLNPMGAVSDSINKAIGSKVIKDAKADWVVRTQNRDGVRVSSVGVEFQFVF